MNCNKCDRPLLPQDDVNSSRYKEMGCLQCQISIIADHKYGKNIEPVPHGITPVETINCSRCGKAVSTPVPTGTIVRAFMECPECVEKQPADDFGHVLKLLMVITKDQALRILALINGAHGGSEIEVLDEDYRFAKKLIEHFHINDYGWLLTALDDLERAGTRTVQHCLHLWTKPYDIGFDSGICCGDCGRMM